MICPSCFKKEEGALVQTQIIPSGGYLVRLEYRRWSPIEWLDDWIEKVKEMNNVPLSIRGLKLKTFWDSLCVPIFKVIMQSFS